MAVKLLPLASPKKIRYWVNLFARLSSVPDAVDFGILEETHRISRNSSNYESKIKSLRSKLVPDDLIRVLGSTMDIESSVRIFRWAAIQKSFQHTAGTYCVIILKLGLAGNVKEMEEFCQNMIRDRCPGAEDALVSLVEKFVDHGRTNVAIQVLASMITGGLRPTTELFNVVLGALVAEKGELKDVIFVYKEMVKAGRVPTIDTLNHLLEALFDAGWVDSALDQYRRMNKKGCHPNRRTFEIIIRNLTTKGRVDDAIVIMLEMLELGMEMDSRFSNYIIPLLCRENKLMEGMRLFDRMKTSKLAPDPSVYRTLIHHLCADCLVDEANKLLEEMIGSGVVPSDDVLEDMVVGLCKLGKMPEAINLLEDKEVLATSPHNALLSCCCNAGVFFLAKELLQKMCERDIADRGSWNILIRWLSANFKLKQALQVLGRMIVGSWIPDSSTDSALVLGYCKLGKHGDALKLYDRLRASSGVLDLLSYSELIKCLCEVGKTVKATEVFRYMSMKKHPLESTSFDMLIKGDIDKRGTHEAREILSLAAECGISYSDETYTIMLNGLSEKPKDQLTVLAQMVVRGFGISSEAYAILIRGALTSLDRAKEASLLFDRMVAEGAIPESECLLDLVSIFAQHSQLHMISCSIDKLLSSLVLDLDMYCLLINGLWKEGCKSKACELLDLMLDRGLVPDATTHGLFTRPTSIEETNWGNLESGNSIVEDNISSILTEGLGRI